MLNNPDGGSAKTISDARNAPLLHDINFLGVKDQLYDKAQDIDDSKSPRHR